MRKKEETFSENLFLENILLEILCFEHSGRFIVPLKLLCSPTVMIHHFTGVAIFHPQLTYHRNDNRFIARKVTAFELKEEFIPVYQSMLRYEKLVVF